MSVIDFPSQAKQQQLALMIGSFSTGLLKTFYAGCPVPIFSYFFLFFEPIPIFSYFLTKTSYFPIF